MTQAIDSLEEYLAYSQQYRVQPVERTGDQDEFRRLVEELTGTGEGAARTQAEILAARQIAPADGGQGVDLSFGEDGPPTLLAGGGAGAADFRGLIGAGAGDDTARVSDQVLAFIAARDAVITEEDVDAAASAVGIGGEDEDADSLVDLLLDPERREEIRLENEIRHLDRQEQLAELTAHEANRRAALEGDHRQVQAENIEARGGAVLNGLSTLAFSEGLNTYETARDRHADTPDTLNFRFL